MSGKKGHGKSYDDSDKDDGADGDTYDEDFSVGEGTKQLFEEYAAFLDKHDWRDEATAVRERIREAPLTSNP